MEVKDKLKPYLGTKTILIIDTQQEWDIIIPFLRFSSNSPFYSVEFYPQGTGIRLENLGQETKETKDFYLERKETNYKEYHFLHSKDLLNTTRKYNLWKLKLTTS